MKNQVFSYSALTLLLLFSANLLAQDKVEKPKRGTPPAGQADDSASRQQKVSPDQVLVPTVDDGRPIYGMQKEVKQIDQGIRNGNLVVIEGGPRGSKSAAKLQWLRTQRNVKLMSLDFGKMRSITRTSFDAASAIEEMARHIRQENIDHPEQTTVLDIDRLSDYGDMAKTLLEATMRARIPAIVEADMELSDLYIRQNPHINPRTTYVRPQNLEEANLRAAVQNLIESEKQRYKNEKNFDVPTSAGLADYITETVIEYMPDNQIVSAEQLVKNAFNEFYNERILNRTQLSKWRDELSRIDLELKYNNGAIADEIKMKTGDSQPGKYEKLMTRKALIEGWIADAKNYPDQLQESLERKEKSLTALSKSVEKLKAANSIMGKLSAFTLNMFASSKDEKTDSKADAGKPLETLESLNARVLTLTQERDTLKAQLDDARREQPGRILDNQLINVSAAEMTELPLAVFSSDMEDLLLGLEDRVETYGQDEALHAGAKELRGVIRGSAPGGFAVVANIGSAGGGKTSTGEGLAKEVHMPTLYISGEEYDTEIKMTNVNNSGRGYEGSNKPETTVFGRIFAMPKFSMVIMDEVDKAYKKFLSMFVTGWDKGIQDWEGKQRSWRGKIVWITANQGQEFPEKFAAILKQYAEMSALPEDSQEGTGSFEFNGKKVEIKGPKNEARKAIVETLKSWGSTEEQLKAISLAEGNQRFTLSSAMAGRYLNSIDSARWPREMLSRLTVIFYKPHTPESLAKVVDKFVRQYRRDIRQDIKTRVYLDQTVVDSLNAAYDKETGARPINRRLRTQVSEVLYELLPKMDLTTQVARISMDHGNFVATAVDKATLFNAYTAGMDRLKAVATETDLKVEDEKFRRNGVIPHEMMRIITESIHVSH